MHTCFMGTESTDMLSTSGMPGGLLEPICTCSRNKYLPEVEPAIGTRAGQQRAVWRKSQSRNGPRVS